MVDLEKVRYPSITPHTHNTNTVVALAQAETEVKLGLQVGTRLTDTFNRTFQTHCMSMEIVLTLKPPRYQDQECSWPDHEISFQS